MLHPDDEDVDIIRIDARDIISKALDDTGGTANQTLRGRERSDAHVIKRANDTASGARALWVVDDDSTIGDGAEATQSKVREGLGHRR